MAKGELKDAWHRPSTWQIPSSVRIAFPVMYVLHALRPSTADFPNTDLMEGDEYSFLITADDMDGNAPGSFGGLHDATPHLDTLAAME